MEDKETASALKGLFDDPWIKEEDDKWWPDSSSFQITDVYSVVDSEAANPVFDRNFNIKITDVSSLNTETEPEIINPEAAVGPRLTGTPPDLVGGGDSPYHMPIIKEGSPDSAENSETGRSCLITSTTDQVVERSSVNVGVRSELQQWNNQSRRRSVITSTGTLSSLGEGGEVANTPPVKRKRGRPKGSKNKRKRGLSQPCLPCVSCSCLSERSR